MGLSTIFLKLHLALLGVQFRPLEMGKGGDGPKTRKAMRLTRICKSIAQRCFWTNDHQVGTNLNAQPNQFI